MDHVTCNCHVTFTAKLIIENSSEDTINSKNPIIIRSFINKIDEFINLNYEFDKGKWVETERQGNIITW